MGRSFEVIAVDFDGTLCENEFPKIGAPNLELIKYLRDKQRKGARLILWTCRCDEQLADAVDWCVNKHGLVFDVVNDNLPGMISAFGGSNPRKVYADIYIDDRMSNEWKLPFVKEEKTNDNNMQIET